VTVCEKVITYGLRLLGEGPNNKDDGEKGEKKHDASPVHFATIAYVWHEAGAAFTAPTSSAALPLTNRAAIFAGREADRSAVRARVLVRHCGLAKELATGSRGRGLRASLEVVEGNVLWRHLCIWRGGVSVHCVRCGLWIVACRLFMLTRICARASRRESQPN
jgi:hypothetical protein